MAVEANSVYQFKIFRLDPVQRLLFRNGQPVPLPPRAVDTLVALVESADRLVTKEEFRSRVWNGSIVEEGNLTFTVAVLRRTLGDDGNGNSFIETVPKRGYRFVAPVSVVAPTPTKAGNGAGKRFFEAPLAAHLPPRTVPEQKNPRFRLLLYELGGLVLVLLAAAGIWLSQWWAAPRVTSYKPLTADREFKPGRPLLSDGVQVYFTEGIRMPGPASVSAKGGPANRIFVPFSPVDTLDLSPDRTDLLVVRKSDNSLWSLRQPGGVARRIGDITALAACWSPDARRIAYAQDRDLFIANADGSNSRHLATLPSTVGWLRWSPDGKRLRFTVFAPPLSPEGNAIWHFASDGTGLRRLFPGWHNPPDECCGNWTPDGRHYIFQSPTAPVEQRTDLWTIPESSRYFPFVKTYPKRLTSGPLSFHSAVSSLDGKHLFAVGEQRLGELVIWDQKRHEFVSFLRGLSGFWVTFSNDGQYLAYIDLATRTLWRARSDGSDRVQLTFEPLQVEGLALSPDSRSIAFCTHTPGSPSRIHVMPLLGGPSQEILPPDKAGENRADEGIPSWSNDGQQMVFGDIPRVFAQDDGTHALHLFDLKTGKLSTLPGSGGLWTARWSPDGRYISALTIARVAGSQKLMLYDVNAKTWRELGSPHIDNPTWSHDSRYIYFTCEGSEAGTDVFRIAVSDGKIERVATFDGINRAASWLSGLTPDDSPLILRDIGTQEVYALDVDWGAGPL
jgi:DNA-binding winged helix-turn-helix (wHTH) protein/Tol biopolymer transport system component